MAVTVTPILLEINDCEATTGWSGSSSVQSDIFRQGAASLGLRGSAAANTFDYTGVPLSTASEDLTDGRHVYVWMNNLTPNRLDTFANGAMTIRVGDGTNTSSWFVGGKDTYAGGWERFIIDPLSTPNTDNGVTLTAVTLIGLNMTQLSMSSGNNPNLFFDIVHIGTGLRITGGSDSDPGTFDEIESIDQDTAQAFGIIQKISGVFLVKGKLVFGATGSTTTSFFRDSGQVIAFEDRPLAPVGANLFEIAVEGNTGGTSDFQLGNVVGQGSDSVGIEGITVTAGDLAAKPKLNFADANIDVLKIYNFSGSNVGQVLFGDSSAGLSGETEIVDCSFSNADIVDLNVNASPLIIRNTTTSSTNVSGDRIELRAGATRDIEFLNETAGGNDRIIRSTGSFTTDGFTAGMSIHVSGVTGVFANNGTFTVTAVGASAITLGDDDTLTDSSSNLLVKITGGPQEASIRLKQPLDINAAELRVVLGDGFTSVDDSTGESLSVTDHDFSTNVQFVKIYEKKTWDIINPTWTVFDQTDLNFSFSTGVSVNEKFQAEIIVQEPSGAAIDAASTYIFERGPTVDLPAVNIVLTNSTGEANSDILTTLFTSDGVTGLNTILHTNFALKVFKYPKTPFVTSLGASLSSKQTPTVTLINDTAIVTPSSATAIANGSTITLSRDTPANTLIKFTNGTGSVEVGDSITQPGIGASGILFDKVEGDDSSGTFFLTSRSSVAFVNGTGLQGATASWNAAYSTGSAIDYTWNVNAAGLSLQTTYEFISAKMATGATGKFEESIEWGEEVNALLLEQASAGFFTNRTVRILEGIFISNVQAGSTIQFFTGDTGDTFTPEASVTLELNGVVEGSVSFISLDSAPAINLLTGGDSLSAPGSGIVSGSFQYTSDVPITIRVRLSSGGDGLDRYLPFTSSGTITVDGFTLTVNQILDTIAATGAV